MFKMPEFDDHTPLNQHPFRHWLTANIRKVDMVRGTECMSEWLKSLGFVEGEDHISEEDFNTLRYVVDHWYRTTPYFQPIYGEPLFSNTGKLEAGDGRFYVTGRERVGAYYLITGTLKKMLEKTGWIYSVTPDTTYFVVENGRLFARYRQITGQRFICELEKA